MDRLIGTEEITVNNGCLAAAADNCGNQSQNIGTTEQLFTCKLGGQLTHALGQIAHGL